MPPEPRDPVTYDEELPGPAFFTGTTTETVTCPEVRTQRASRAPRDRISWPCCEK